MKPKSEEGTAWSQYESTPIERLRLKRAAFNIGSILGNRFTRRGDTFWVNVSQDLLAMAEKGVSYVGSRDTPPSRLGYFSYYFFGIISGLGGALILGWRP